jgi:hypothetical protein
VLLLLLLLLLLSCLKKGNIWIGESYMRHLSTTAIVDLLSTNMPRTAARTTQYPLHYDSLNHHSQPSTPG